MRTKLQILKDIRSIYMQLSPENLWEDGMLTPAAARKKETLLMRQLSLLFKELGYEVDEYEIDDEIRKAQRMASSHTAAVVKAPRTLGTFTRKVVKSLQSLFKDPASVSFDPKKTEIRRDLGNMKGTPYYTAYINVAGLPNGVLCVTPVDETTIKMPNSINVHGVGKDYAKLQEWVLDSLRGQGLLNPEFDPTPSVDLFFDRIKKTLLSTSFKFKGITIPLYNPSTELFVWGKKDGDNAVINILSRSLELQYFGEWRQGMGGSYRSTKLSGEESLEFRTLLGKTLVKSLDTKYPGLTNLMGGERYLVELVEDANKSFGQGMSLGYGNSWVVSYDNLQKYIASFYA